MKKYEYEFVGSRDLSTTLNRLNELGEQGYHAICEVSAPAFHGILIEREVGEVASMMDYDLRPLLAREAISNLKSVVN